MVIEITTFRLADDVDEAAFLEADERVRTGFLYHQPGLVRSTTARDGDGEWTVVLLWGSHNHADAAATVADTDPANRELMALVDGATIRRKRYTTLD